MSCFPFSVFPKKLFLKSLSVTNRCDWCNVSLGYSSATRLNAPLVNTLSVAVRLSKEVNAVSPS